MKNIIVFGSKGMLGRYVYTYLKNQNYNVIGISRDDLDLSTVTLDELKNTIKKHNDPIVMNCAGAIVQKYNHYGSIKMIEVNSIFPWKLANVCEELHLKYIHITTDCVYSGLKGGYVEDDIHDSIDVYGKSKSLGEPNYGTIIRTSIIGEEIGGGASFVEWVKSEKGKKVNGYLRNIWNGVTCLQYSKIVDQIISENLFWNGVRHIYSPDTVVKANLIRLVSNVYDLNVNVIDTELPKQLCDRTISSKYDISLFNIPTIEEQIIEMKNYSL